MIVLRGTRRGDSSAGRAGQGPPQGLVAAAAAAGPRGGRVRVRRALAWGAESAVAEPGCRGQEAPCPRDPRSGPCESSEPLGCFPVTLRRPLPHSALCLTALSSSHSQ